MEFIIDKYDIEHFGALAIFIKTGEAEYHGIDVSNEISHFQAEKALSDHRADRAANKARREELNTIIYEAQTEMKLLEYEYMENENDENILLRRIGQITIGE